MALSIRDPETDRLARELAQLTGETMTQAIRTSLEERLARERRRREQDVQKRYDAIMEVLERIWAMPVFDGRSADEIIGYDEQGLPTGWSSTLRPWLQSSAGSPTGPGIWS